MDRALDLKPEVTQCCGFESRLRQEVHDCSPGAAQSAAHCSKCVHLDGLNAENTFHSSLYSVLGVDRLSAPILSILPIIDIGHFKNRFADIYLFIYLFIYFFLFFLCKQTYYLKVTLFIE